MKTCKIEGCEKPAVGRQLCSAHWHQARRNGTLSTHAKIRGGGCINSNGYRLIHTQGKQRLEHILVAEAALGKPLPKGAMVHHINENRSDNRPKNLVICPDQAYHKLIHRRMKALAACGHADWVQCVYCKGWAPPDADGMYVYPTREHGARHLECHKAYMKQWKAHRHALA